MFFLTVPSIATANEKQNIYSKELVAVQLCADREDVKKNGYKNYVTALRNEIPRTSECEYGERTKGAWILLAICFVRQRFHHNITIIAQNGKTSAGITFPDNCKS
ncbi:hypothetical protein Tcan_01185, partial [Toxocara canis]